MNPKLSQIQMSDFTESQKMKVVQLHKQNPKQLLKPTVNPNIAHLGPKMSKTTPKLSQNKILKLKETNKIKFVALYEQTPKQF